MIYDVYINNKGKKQQRIYRILVTSARVHFLDISSQIVLERKWMLAWPPSVSTTYLPIQEVSLLSLGLNTFQIWKWKNGTQMAQITVGIIQWLKRHTSSLSQEPCVIRPPKTAILLLSVHPLLHQCLLHLYLLTWLTFLCTCPRAQLISLSALDQNPPQSLSKGAVGAWPSAGFHSNWWPILTSIPPITNNLPTLLSASPGSKDCHDVLFQHGPQLVDVLPGFPSQVWAGPNH